MTSPDKTTYQSVRAPRYGHSMAMVETVRGPVDTGALGPTLMHGFGLDVITPFEDRVATVAALCERGVTDAQLDTMLVANPRRFLSP
jgi:hypothetical protein